jgi:hypothetical protein
MRLSDKMTQTRHTLDDAYEGLGDGITTALNQMFDYGREAERLYLVKWLEGKRHHIKCDCECDEELIELIKGEQK